MSACVRRRVRSLSRTVRLVDGQVEVESDKVLQFDDQIDEIRLEVRRLEANQGVNGSLSALPLPSFACRSVRSSIECSAQLPGRA